MKKRKMKWKSKNLMAHDGQFVHPSISFSFPLPKSLTQMQHIKGPMDLTQCFLYANEPAKAKTDAQ